jgi:phosphomannomutase/phosphoglucomutase
MIPAKLFGTSGIRGRVDEFLTPEFAERLALAFASFLEDHGTVLVARDVRPQSDLIRKAVISGLSAGGVRVVDCGVSSTPATLVALKKFRHKAAVVVTGSHIPAPATGILFFLDDTGEMDREGELRLEALFQSGELRKVPLADRGSVESFDIQGTYEDEMRRQLGSIGGYRLVVDPGNGATCNSLPRVLEAAGCEVITINGEPDGTFPSRPPYPEPSNLGQLAAVVKEKKADIGLGTDSDGDRVLFATPDGRVQWGDVAGALFARNELTAQRGGRIITTINTSSLIQFACQKYRGELVVTKVGPPAMAQALRKYKDVVFATEESGKHIWPSVILYGDAALATGKLLRIMRQDKKTLEELESELPKFYQFKSTIPCRELLKAEVTSRIMETWKPAEEVQISTLDGLKVTHPNGSWFLIRASGTEPVIRCQSESSESNEARRLLSLAEQLVRSRIDGS